jgi:archaemetzincin
MNRLELLPIGAIERSLVEDLRTRISKKYKIPCDILPQNLSPDAAFNAERQQYHSSELLNRMQSYLRPGCWRLLGITAKDLYIPILTFVFGEAQLGGPCAVVSTHRLHQEFYGLPADPELLRERLLKEAVHEVGHTVELTHCHDYYCVMSASHSVEWIDLKAADLCPDCESRVLGQAKGTAEHR